MHASSLRDALARLFYGWVVLAVAALGLFTSGPVDPGAWRRGAGARALTVGRGAGDVSEEEGHKRWALL